MKKSALERFIQKYNLGGAGESVTWSVKGNEVSTKFLSEDRHVIGDVKAKNLELENGDYSIYETGALRGLLSVLGDDIKVEVQKSNNRSTALTFKDGSSKASFVLASSENIPKVPDSKQMPDFENSVVIDNVFNERFSKAKSALTDVETFTVLSSGKSIEVVIGYSSMNTNRVTINTTPIDMAKIEPIDFSARYMKEILAANRDAKTGKLEISSAGLARITFEIDDFEVTYYLPQVQREN